MVGTSLGHFRILRKLGEGGMGQVYLAEDTRLGRKVALKLLPDEIAHHSDRRNRFLREARAVAALNHPHIVSVHSVEETDERVVLVLEYVRGKTLAEIIPRNGMLTARILEIGIPLADAVAAAHRQGVIHRDLKPGNVMLDDDGRVKVLDFGLARIEGGSAADGPTATGSASRLVSTEEGKILGTVAYMSPEQLEGRKLDHRTDIFSLGVLLYEMSTGRRPFQGESQASVISSILRDDPPSVTELKADLPRHLARILRLCLAKDPERRYQTALDVRNELALLKEETESGDVEVAVPVRPPRRRQVRWAAIGTPVVAALAIAGFLQLRDRNDVAPATAATSAWSATSPGPGAALGTVRRLTYSGTSGLGIWSPNGDEIVYGAVHDGRSQMMVVPASGGTPRVLYPEQAMAWNWSPDGKSILAVGRTDAGTWGSIQIDRYGAPPRLLVEDSTFPDLSPDRRTLTYHTRGGESTGVWTMDMASGEKHLVVGPPAPGTNFYKPQWSPTGDRIAYSKWIGSGHELWIHDMEKGTDRRVETNPVHVGGHYDWTSDGQFLATAGSLDGIWSMWMVPVDGGAAIPLTQGGTGSQERHASIAPDDLAIVFGRTDDASRVAIVDLDSGLLREPLRPGVPAGNPSYLPDNRHVVFQAVIDGRWQIWSADVQGEGEIQPVLPIGETWSFRPTVLPDGSILHVRAEQRPVTIHGAMEWDQTLWLSSADGGRHRALPAAGSRVYRISPGGFFTDRWLVTSLSETGTREDILLLRDGEEPQIVWQDNEERGVTSFDWGPRENEMILTINGPGRDLSRISAMDLDTGELRTVVDVSETLSVDAPVQEIAMAPDRTQIALLAYVSREGESARFELLTLDLSSGSLQQVHVFSSRDQPASLRWSPDGQCVAIHLADKRSDLYVWEAAGRAGV